MSFTYYGTRPDIESGMRGFIHQRSLLFRAVRNLRPDGEIFMASIALQILIITFLDPPQIFIHLLRFAFIPVAVVMSMCVSVSQLQAQAADPSRLLGRIGEFVRQRPLLLRAATNFAYGGNIFAGSIIMQLMIVSFFQLRTPWLDWTLIPTSVILTVCVPRPQGQSRARDAAPSHLLGQTDLPFHMPLSRAFAAGRQLQERPPLPPFPALHDHDREVVYLEVESLRESDSENASATPPMSEEYINALPVHIYQVSGRQTGGSSQQHAFSLASIETKQDLERTDTTLKSSKDELTCSICLEQVNRGELVRSLPCLHLFHANCIDPWLWRQGTCPLCKFWVRSGLQESWNLDMVQPCKLVI